MRYKSWVGEVCEIAGREYIYEVQIKLKNTSDRSILPVFHPPRDRCFSDSPQGQDCPGLHHVGSLERINSRMVTVVAQFRKFPLGCLSYFG
jgi:hypothetical protein